MILQGEIMNKTLQFTSCAIILLMALAVIPGSGVVSADTTNESGDGSTTKTLTFNGEIQGIIG